MDFHTSVDHQWNQANSHHYLQASEHRSRK